MHPSTSRGALIWQTEPRARTTVPLPKLPAGLSSRVAISPKRSEDLERLMYDRTVLVVAHRLNTIYTADRIAVLENGHMVEAGSHAELLERGGLYARLVGTDRRVPV